MATGVGTPDGNIVRAHFLADAFELVARANHYMVGIVEDYLDDELDRAEQILINKQNAGPQKGVRYATFERALDMVETARKARLRAASQAVQQPVPK